MNAIQEESPVGDSQKNGYIERAVLEVQALARALVHETREWRQAKFELARPIVIWGIRYSSQLLNRPRRPGDDGRAASGRREVRPRRRRLSEFGELPTFLTVAVGERWRKLDGRFRAGVYVGLVDGADEVIVLTGEGYFKANAIRRPPEAQRGDRIFAESCKGLPWRGPEKSGDDAEVAVPCLAAAPIVPEEELPPPQVGRPAAGPRRVYVRREVELRPVAGGGYGRADGCPGCSAAKAGKTAAACSDACRARIDRPTAQDAESNIRLEEAKKGKTEEVGPSAPRAAPRTATAASPGSASASAAAVPEEEWAPDVEMGAKVPALPDVVTEAEGAGARGSGDLGSIAKQVTYDLGKICAMRLEVSVVDSFEKTVSEIFGRGEFLERSREFGQQLGFALDLRAGWDSRGPKQKKDAMALRSWQKPILLIGSARCAAWAALLTFDGASEETVKRFVEEAANRAGARAITRRGQIGDTNYSQHEGPNAARSWRARGIQGMLLIEAAHYARNDQCEAGHAVAVKNLFGQVEDLIAQARGGWMTKSIRIARGAREVSAPEPPRRIS